MEIHVALGPSVYSLPLWMPGSQPQRILEGGESSTGAAAPPGEAHSSLQAPRTLSQALSAQGPAAQDGSSACEGGKLGQRASCHPQAHLPCFRWCYIPPAPLGPAPSGQPPHCSHGRPYATSWLASQPPGGVHPSKWTDRTRSLAPEGHSPRQQVLSSTHPLRTFLKGGKG